MSGRVIAASGAGAVATAPGERRRARAARTRVQSAASTAAPHVALVVDDEPSVRRLISAVLARNGWSVVEAADATRALAASERLSSRVDLLVTDLEMPGPSGVALARALRSTNSALPVLLVSAADLPDPPPPDPFVFVRKPFALAELLARVNSLTAG